MELATPLRPQITNLTEPAEILRVMISYRREREKSFSVMKACRTLYRVSPALVTLIISGKRKITPDRVDELSKLMGLSGAEKQYFRNLVHRSTGRDEMPTAPAGAPAERSRKSTSTHILSDWLNVYVKDCFHIQEIQKNPDLLYKQLAPLASNKRIKKSFEFLLREGHLRRLLDGRVVMETNLTVTDPQVSSQKIRAFHKAALKVAQQGIDLHASTERYANTLLVTLSAERYAELIHLIQEFSEKLKDFAEVSTPEDERLYQVIVNVSPTGGVVL